MLALTRPVISTFFFFFNDTATTEIYTLSLHDALPISGSGKDGIHVRNGEWDESPDDKRIELGPADRKSTRLNSSHGYISYAVFCLKKKKSWHNYIVRHHISTEGREGLTVKRSTMGDAK